MRSLIRAASYSARALLGYVEKQFDDKDCGLWEIRGTAEYFTHYRVRAGMMSWITGCISGATAAPAHAHGTSRQR
ncbi:MULTISPECIES: hypothetical protein [unclassified Arthrobacter]|uniref:hypothetical protein n=1 Tax=unclassified Arthrobacter TaxID=235627 RepID=UPI003394F953